MKRFLGKLLLAAGFILLISLMAAPLFAQKNKPSFSKSSFRQIRDIVCKDYDEDDCGYKNFDIEGIDLNGDKELEWFFYGPSIECGAHGNCPLTILQKKGGKWNVLYSGWGNLYEGTKALSTQRKGYRDLEIASDFGAFYWIKEKLIWNGTKYAEHPDSTTYYISAGDKLIPVSKKQWEDCTKNHRNCPGNDE